MLDKRVIFCRSIKNEYNSIESLKRAGNKMSRALDSCDAAARQLIYHSGLCKSRNYKVTVSTNRE